MAETKEQAPTKIWMAACCGVSFWSDPELSPGTVQIVSAGKVVLTITNIRVDDVRFGRDRNATDTTTDVQ